MHDNYVLLVRLNYVKSGLYLGLGGSDVPEIVRG